MPQINLLQSGSKKKAARPLAASDPRIELHNVASPLILRSSVCLGVCLIVWIFLAVDVSKKQKTLIGFEEKVKVIFTNPKEMERIKNERAALEKKVRLIDNLSSRKFYWYEKLDFLANLIPDGVWLTEVYFKQEKGTSKDSDRSANPSLGEKTILTVKGTAVAYKIQDAVTLVGDFIKNLQTNKDFSSDFVEIKLNTVSKGAIGGLDVMRFELSCESK